MNAKSVRLWLIVVGITIVFATIGTLSVQHWMKQAKEERDALLILVQSFAQSDRAHLKVAWAAKAHWIPGENARQALVVLPRTPDKDFDAIYVLFSDDHVSATLALTPVAGYFNGQSIDIRRNPQTLLARPLRPEERRSLSAIIHLLLADLETTRRDHPLDTQAARFTWTEQVVKTARALFAAQEQASRQ